MFHGPKSTKVELRKWMDDIVTSRFSDVRFIPSISAKTTWHLSASVHSQAISLQVRRACLHYVPRHCTALPHVWLKPASTVLRACCQPLDYPCTNRSDLVGLDQTVWKQPQLDYFWTFLGFALQPTHVPLSQWSPHRESTPRLRRVSVTARRVSTESQAPFKMGGQKPPVKAPPSSSAMLWAS